MINTLDSLLNHLESNSSTFRKHRSRLDSKKTEQTEKSNIDKNQKDILAEYIISTPEKRFVNDALLEKINEVINTSMDKNIYDSDNDNIVDLSKKSLTTDSIEWNNILHKPSLDMDKIDETIKLKHSHDNIESLQLLSNSKANTPLWNNKEWPYPTSSKIQPLNEFHNRNIYIDSEDPKELSKDGDIWFNINFSTKSLISINVRIDNEWYKLDINNLMTSLANNISKTFNNKQPFYKIDLNDSKINLEDVIRKELNRLIDDRIFNEELICDGITHKYLITHSFNTRKVICQIIDNDSGSELDRKEYTLIRNSDNTIILTFYNPPIKNKTYTILLLKVDY